MANETDRNPQQGQQKNSNTSGQSNQSGQNKWQDNTNQSEDRNRKNPSQGIDPHDRKDREGSDNIEKRRAS